MLKFLLLALLRGRPMHGYEMKSTFEAMLGGTWTLNIGQIYNTLNRLEDDGLIEPTVVHQDLLPDRKVFNLTELGHKELTRWLEEPVQGLVRLRDEVFLKIVSLGASDPNAAVDLIDLQRSEYAAAVATVSKLAASDEVSETTELLLDALLYRLEADIRWLDECERRYRDRR